MSRVKVFLGEPLRGLTSLQDLDGSTLSITARPEDAQIHVGDSVPDADAFVIVVWQKHDVEMIGKACANPKVRGFFLQSEVLRDSAELVGLLHDLSREAEMLDALRQAAKLARESGKVRPIGSMVKVSKKDAAALANSVSPQKMTSLFFDRAMLNVMSRLHGIIGTMGPCIDVLRDKYLKVIQDAQASKYFTTDKQPKFDRSGRGVIGQLAVHREENHVKFPPILLTGKTGVGKTLVARWLHQGKFPGVFREVNASGLSAELFEIEVFGYVQGAHSEAKSDTLGAAMESIGGVLFLDEIGDLDPAVQPKILKFLEDCAFRPLGWLGQEIYAPQLIIAATNKDLEAEVAAGRFRQDLLARFRHRVEIPPLAERRSAIPALVDFLLQNRSLRGVGTEEIRYVADEALAALCEMEFQDNFRGLERVLSEASHRTREWKLDVLLKEAVQRGEVK